MDKVRTRWLEFAWKEGVNVSRDGKIEVGGEGWFATNEGRWGVRG